jgi:hypothetical protein
MEDKKKVVDKSHTVPQENRRRYHEDNEPTLTASHGVKSNTHHNYLSKNESKPVIKFHPAAP